MRGGWGVKHEDVAAGTCVLRHVLGSGGEWGGVGGVQKTGAPMGVRDVARTAVTWAVVNQTDHLTKTAAVRVRARTRPVDTRKEVTMPLAKKLLTSEH